MLEMFVEQNAIEDHPLPKIYKYEGDIIIGSYNVHCFYNPFSTETNVLKILKLLSELNCDVLILQEFMFVDADILSKFKQMGYVDFRLVINGNEVSTDVTSYICIMAKSKFDYVECIDLTVSKYYRQCVYFKVFGITVIAVHLEIGERYHHLTSNDKLVPIIVNNNINSRLKQLKHIIDAYPGVDILIGDFNFQPNEKEFVYLLDNNFRYQHEYSKSNPYNRCDLLFINNKSIFKIRETRTIKCNYSDHLPILARINTKVT